MLFFDKTVHAARDRSRVVGVDGDSEGQAVEKTVNRRAARIDDRQAVTQCFEKDEAETLP